MFALSALVFNFNEANGVYFEPQPAQYRMACCQSPQEAAVFGHLECLRHAHEQGRPWDENTPVYAAGGGHLECLKYAHEQGCPWDRNTTASAAEHKHLACLKYAHQNGCPWDSEVLNQLSDNLEGFRYAYERGCPWDKDTLQVIVEMALYWFEDCDDDACDHIELMRYARDKGIPWEREYCSILFDGCSVVRCVNCITTLNNRKQTEPALRELRARSLLPTVLVSLICDFACNTFEAIYIFPNDFSDNCVQVIDTPDADASSTPKKE